MTELRPIVPVMTPALLGRLILEMGIGYDLSIHGASRRYAAAVACGLSPMVWLTEVTMCGQRRVPCAVSPGPTTEAEVIAGYWSGRHAAVMHIAVDVTAEFAAMADGAGVDDD